MAEPATELRDLSAIPGFDSRPSIDPESANELDKLLDVKQKEKENPPKVDDPPKTDDSPKADDSPKTDDSPKADDPPKTDDLPKTDDPPKLPAPKDEFDSVELPPYSKPKSHEAFDKVKAMAREKIAATEKERDDLKKERDELAARVSAGLPKEIEEELKALREFRNKMDVEADPEFKTFDSTIKQNIESIYSRMKAEKFTDEQIEQVKNLGGPSEVDWDHLTGKMSTGLKRFIDAKLVENESLKDKKDRALAEAKANAEAYLKSKHEAVTDVAVKQNKQVEEGVNKLIPQLGWFEDRRPKDGATEADKKAVEAHNSLIKESKEFLSQAISDNSPELRGLLAVGYVQLLKLRQDHAALKAEKDIVVKDLEGKLKEANALLDKVKRASTARLQSTPIQDGNPTTPNLTSPNTSGAEALDTLAKQHFAAK